MGVMHHARPLLAALLFLLLLTFAAAASAHETGEVNHRDTPADLAGADIDRTLALSAMAGHASPDMPQFLPTTWCGTRLTGDDTAHAAFPASQKQIKVVYAYGSDAPDNSAQWRDALQANVSRIEQFLTLQTCGQHALRFDMRTVSSPQYTEIQVS